MSPKKRGKRRLKENMENEEPYLMSNFNSNNSLSAKVSDGNLLSSASSIYNVTGQSNIVDSQGNLTSATPSHHLFEYSEDPSDKYMSNENRVMSISPSKFDRYIKLDPSQFQNPYGPRSKKSSICETIESKHDLSVVKEASACLEASSIGTKGHVSKTVGCKGNVKDKRTKSFIKKSERVREIKVGSFSS